MRLRLRENGVWSACARIVCFLLAGGLMGVGAQQTKTSEKLASTQKQTSQAARGKYLVEGVAMCGTCHTPRDESGYLEKSHWLDGAALWLLPARQNMDWPLKAPRIAGSPSASDEQMVTLLTTGVWKDGTRLRPPMPQFRMNKEDAEAVVVYLRSLTPSPEE